MFHTLDQPPSDGCAQCSVRSRSDWAGLPPRAAAVVGRLKQTRMLEAGTTLFRQGESNLGLYCVSEGLIGLRMTHANGTEALVGLGWPGETLGARAFLRNSAHVTTAVALTAARVCLIHRREALRLTQEAPEVHLALVARCLAAMDQAQAGLLHNAALSNRARLCLFLARLACADVPGVADPLPGGGVVLTLPMPRTDLAGMLGVQPETLSRLLARLRAEGLLRLSGRALVLPRPEALAAQAT